MATTNQNITFQGNKLTVLGKSIKAGDPLPDFKLTGNGLADVPKSQFANKVLVICSVPSLDTPVCQLETKRFNEEVSKLGSNVALLVVSMDLPFAMTRWCGAEGVKNLTTASDYKYRTFGHAFGTFTQDNGLLCRAVFVADKNGVVQFVEYVDDITNHPNYEAAIGKVKELL